MRSLAPTAVSYCMVLMKCGSHQSNLVVMVAVCGAVVKNPSENCPVTGACVRLFKYLMPAYTEEFVQSLWMHIFEDLNFCGLEDVAPDQTHRMQRLVGKGRAVFFERLYLFMGAPAGTPKPPSISPGCM